MQTRTSDCKLALVLFSATLVLNGYGCDRSSAPQAASAPPKTKAPEPEKPKEPLIKKAEVADWCPEHGVPESICTRCNASLIDGFKKKGDWCAKHGLPESQCLDCHPELKSKFEAMRPKNG